MADVDRKRVLEILENVNLTKIEKEIVIKTELDGERLYDMAEVFSLSVDSVSHIKRTAMQKIGIFFTKQLQ